MKIALIGLSYLQSCGFLYIIKEKYPTHEVCIYAPDNAGWQDADCHIVSASALASLARFLMSRLDRVLLVSTSATSHSAISMVSPLASQKELDKAVALLIEGVETYKSAPSQQPLSQREIEVLRLTATGVTSRQIAEQLCISLNTVLTHRKNIAAKTGLHTVSAITHFAMVHGLLQ